MQYHKITVSKIKFIIAERPRMQNIARLNRFGNFSFRIGYLEMRCSKSCYLHDLELVDLFGNRVTEQVYYIAFPYCITK